MMAERGLSLAHTTIMRWIQCYVPEFEKRWNRFARPAGRSWRVDETYVKIRGRWTYLYRAVDKEGNTVDFLLRAKRDVAAAKAFFRRALQRQGQLPHKITLDGYQASHRGAAEALSEHPEGNQCKIRSSKYVSNLIEQDHRSIKLRLGPMLGLKHFRRAATTIAGIELMHRIRKGPLQSWLDLQRLHHNTFAVASLSIMSIPPLVIAFVAADGNKGRRLFAAAPRPHFATNGYCSNRFFSIKDHWRPRWSNRFLWTKKPTESTPG